MNRPFALIALLLVPLTPVRAADAPAKQPSALFIGVDDLNDWIGCLGGHPQTRTPNFDRLAAAGVLFRNAYCPAASCNPSRNRSSPRRELRYPKFTPLGTYFRLAHPHAPGETAVGLLAESGKELRRPSVRWEFRDAQPVPLPLCAGPSEAGYGTAASARRAGIG